jgi:hypothetical protein
MPGAERLPVGGASMARELGGRKHETPCLKHNKDERTGTAAETSRWLVDEDLKEGRCVPGQRSRCGPQCICHHIPYLCRCWLVGGVALRG